MTRLLASFAVVSVLIAATCVVEAQNPAPKVGAVPKSNQVYVKIILPDPPGRDKDRPVVESWIAEQLKKSGQTKFTAATEWVPFVTPGRTVWDGGLDDKTWGCSVFGRIVERGEGRIKVHLLGWGDGGNRSITVSLTDEPGGREIVAVDKVKTEHGSPYVAVLIGPSPDLSVRKTPD